MKKLSPTMIEAMEYAATYSSGEVSVYRRTEGALLARGLISYSVRGRPVVTVAGWAWLKARGIDRPDDWGRYSLRHALTEAYDPSVSDGWRNSRNSDTCRWEGPRMGFVARVS